MEVGERCFEKEKLRVGRDIKKARPRGERRRKVPRKKGVLKSVKRLLENKDVQSLIVDILKLIVAWLKK
jgi:hypothetical protein